MKNKKICIKINKLAIGDDYPVRVMGILNLSPESFYKDSFIESRKIIDTVKSMVENGATLLDIGGRSTAPHAVKISAEQEINRVSKALNTIFENYETSNTLISIDTQYRLVAESALKIFKQYKKDKYFILNDVSALNTDPTLADWLAATKKPVILMASHNVPGDSLGMKQTIFDLKKAITKLKAKNYNTEKNVIIDPAIGRWIPEKTPEYDLESIYRLREFRQLGQPLLVGISRKSFIGAVLNKNDPKDRLSGTLAATAIAVFNGVHIIRTHDVTTETIESIKIAQAIKNIKKGYNND